MRLDFDKVLRFYARRDIQKAIVAVAQDREVGVSFGGKGYGKRPDILQFPSEVLELAKEGVTSFHLSEERWMNPLDIKTGMPRKELEALRSGWDCVLDIDSPYVEYAQITTHLLLEALKFNGVSSAGVKFSGNKGFHIILPFEAFPEIIDDKPARLLFPDGPRMVAMYLKTLIEKHLREKILEKTSVEEIAKAVGKEVKDLMNEKNEFNPFILVDIDTILISTRHLFRAPYSINEKSGLVSVPVLPENVLTFKLRDARMENVKVTAPFLKKATPGEAGRLVLQAFDQFMKQEFIPPEKKTISFLGKDFFPEPPKKKEEYVSVTIDQELIKDELFPPCVQRILQGLEGDGRKRALFILLNFFKTIQLPFEEMKRRIHEWNKKNHEPLRESYLQGQLNWHGKKKDAFLPPNCENEGYYKDLGIKCADTICTKIKNPANYTLLRLKDAQRQKKKIKKTVKKAVKKTGGKRPTRKMVRQRFVEIK